MIVTTENLYFPIGAELRPTGQTNTVNQIEVIWIGHFDGKGYQHTEEGQRYWIRKDIFDALK